MAVLDADIFVDDLPSGKLTNIDPGSHRGWKTSFH